MFTWEPNSHDGGSAVIDYQISRRLLGDISYTIIETNHASTSYTSTGLSLGLTYEWVVQSRNLVGLSPASNSLQIYHALTPEAPAAPLTQISGEYVMISWSAPSDNGSAITAYEIKFKKSDGTFTSILEYCDGTAADIISGLECSIPTTVFNLAPLSLNWGEHVFAIVTATNSIGTSPDSIEGNGAQIVTTPDQPFSLAEV